MRKPTAMGKRRPTLSRVIIGLAGVSAAALCPPTASADYNPSQAQAGACADANNPVSRTAACASSNQAQFATAFGQISGKHGTEAEVSPTKGVFPSGAANGAVVPNYGISSDYLTGSPPSAHGAPVSTTIDGIPAIASMARTVGTMQKKAISSGQSKRFHPPKPLQLAKLEKSAQNIWAAEETLAHVLGAKACSGKTGNDLITCAKAYIRPLKASPPHVGSPSCEGFVYNRYYDIERWTDRMNACGHDNLCKANITLDKTDGIAGKLLSGSDADPAGRQFLQGVLDIDAHSPGGPPNCSKGGLTGDALKACEMTHSLPPIAHVTPSGFQSIAGGGALEAWNCDGKMTNSTFCIKAKGSTTVGGTIGGYLMAKNDFYAATGNLTAAQMFTPTLVGAFSKDPTKYQSVQRLAAELARGQSYYYVGKPPSGAAQGVVRYADDWDFQRHMLDATKNVSERTFRDYAKRKAFVRERGRTFSALFNQVTNPAPKFGIPASVVDQIRGVVPGTVLGSLTSGVDVYQNPVDYQQSLTSAEPSGFDSVKNPWWTYQVMQPPTPTAVDNLAWSGGASLPQIDTSYRYPRLLCPAPDKLQAGSAAHFEQILNGPGGMPSPLPITPINGPALDGPMPVPSRSSTSDVTTAACNYVNAVLDEWARKDMPQALAPADKTPAPAPSGCFANDPACDWDPNDFVSGIDDLVRSQIKNVEHARQEADYKFCREWADASGVGASDTEYAALGKMRAKLQGAYNQISNVPVRDTGKEKNKVPWARNANRPDDDTFGTFGEDRTNAENWGNDLFGVGYSFEAGWEIPVEWEKVDPKAHADKVPFDVCNIGGGAHAGFEAYAYAFGSDKVDILDADLAAGVNDSEDVAVPGVADQGKLNTNMAHTAFDLEFAVAGDSLYDKDEPVPIHGDGAQPVQGSNSWTLFNIPFQISFITLDISVGVGYSYEIDANVAPDSHPDVCHQGKANNGVWPVPAKQPEISLTAGVNAQGELDGIVDASASIAGLVGIGVECDITLLGIGLPATAKASIDPKGLHLDTSLNMSLSTLSGSLSVYAEALFFKLFDITIISWDGFSTRVPLFNTGTTVELPRLDPLGGTGLLNPQRSLINL